MSVQLLRYLHLCNAKLAVCAMRFIYLGFYKQGIYLLAIIVSPL